MNCKNGHPDSHRYSTPRGSRCRLCVRAKNQKWNKQNRGSVIKIAEERRLREKNAADAAAAKLARIYKLQAILEADEG